MECEDCVDLILRHRFCTLTGDFGSGKSTRIPVALYRRGLSVLVVQTTCEAVLRLFHYVMNRVGLLSVGYGAGGVVMYDDTTRLVYATAGHALRLLVGGKRRFDVLLLDEVHYAEFNTEVLRYIAMHGARLLAHATQKAGVLCSGSLTHMQEYPILNAAKVPLVRLGLNRKPIARHTQYRYTTDKPIRSVCADLPATIAEVHHMAPLSRGILVFLPGKAEITRLHTWLEREYGSEMHVSEFHGSTPRDPVDVPVPSTKRRVLLATNALETSVTLPEFDYVIDTMLERRTVASEMLGTTLVTTHISANSAEQRAARVGRVREGIVIRMMHDEKKLASFTPRAVDREPLESLVAWWHVHQVKPEWFFVKGQDEPRLVETLGLLASVGALEKECRLLRAGIHSPVYSFYDGLVLRQLLDLGYPKTRPVAVLVAAAFMALRVGHTTLFEAVLEEKRSGAVHARFLDAYSHMQVYWNVWYWKDVELGASPSESELRKWCTLNGLGYDRIRLAERTLERIGTYAQLDWTTLPSPGKVTPLDASKAVAFVSSELYAQFMPHRLVRRNLDEDRLHYYSEWCAKLKPFQLHATRVYGGLAMVLDTAPERLLVLEGSDPTRTRPGHAYCVLSVVRKTVLDSDLPS